MIFLLLAVCSLGNFVRRVCSHGELPWSSTCCPKCVGYVYEDQVYRDSRKCKSRLRVSELYLKRLRIVTASLGGIIIGQTRLIQSFVFVASIACFTPHSCFMRLICWLTTRIVLRNSIIQLQYHSENI